MEARNNRKIVRYEWVYWSPVKPTWLLRGRDESDFPIAIGDFHELGGTWVWWDLHVSTGLPMDIARGLPVEDAKKLVVATLRLRGIL